MFINLMEAHSPFHQVPVPNRFGVADPARVGERTHLAQMQGVESFDYPLPGETEDAVLAPFVELAKEHQLKMKTVIGVGEYETFTGNTLRQEKFFPAWLFPEDDWFVNRALQGLSESGLSPEVGAYRFCTNAAYSAGVAGVPTVGFGPAKETDAHRVDECLKLEDLAAAARGYAGIIQAVLGREG